MRSVPPPEPSGWGTEVVDDDPGWTAADDEAFWAVLLDGPATPPSLLGEIPESLSPDAAIDYLVELQQEQARLAALEARALTVAAGRYVDERVIVIPSRGDEPERRIVLRDMALEELAAALHRATGTVHDEIVTARLLAGPLAATFDALAAGRITPRHARAIADQSRRFDGYTVAVHQHPARDDEADAARRASFHEACRQLEARVLGLAESATPGRTAGAARRAVAQIDAEGEERRRQQARAQIDVSVWPEADGLGVLFARLPLEQAARIHAALDAQGRLLAQSQGTTIGEGRARALVAAVCSGNGSGAEPGDAAGAAGAVGVEIQVVIDAASLVGAGDAPGSVTVGGTGPQPLTAQAVRDLLLDPSMPIALRRLVTDPVSGHLLDRGRRRYAVTGELRAFLVARNRTCRFPGCTRPATSGQMDHAETWDDGGRTDRANLGPLCLRHHLMKTFCDWRITDSRDDGSCSWRSPQGREYDVDPPPY